MDEYSHAFYTQTNTFRSYLAIMSLGQPANMHVRPLDALTHKLALFHQPPHIIRIRMHKTKNQNVFTQHAGQANSIILYY